MNTELGRELTVPELKVKTVVVVGREDRPHMATMWVKEIGKDYVVFWAGVARTYLMVSIRKDGKLADDTVVPQFEIGQNWCDSVESAPRGTTTILPVFTLVSYNKERVQP